MTAQVSDTLRYQGKAFSITGIDGTGFFDPKAAGLSLSGMGTCCHRGYVCVYEVQDSLKLQTLYPGFSPMDRRRHQLGRGPKLFGKAPRPLLLDEPGSGLSEFIFEEVDQVIPFTGGLLIGRRFIRKLFVHMGFPPGYKFREVHELKFAEGSLTEARDVSAEMAKCRADIANRPLSPEDISDTDEVLRWIDQAFSQDYKL